ncbi:terpene synthase family protein [Streptomyces sp. MNP-20]|uniref:terpene synthase family protein n=1 Tax=Streptomyces sp. MNP-20 TaxID=2721165 RepID=UPI0015529903|nr:terpene synthase family protein [Streptomyces sp. MNP-20]
MTGSRRPWQGTWPHREPSRIYPPHIDLPFWTGQHPEASLAQQRAARWALGHGLVRDGAVGQFEQLGYGRLLSSLCPQAGLDDLVLVVLWNVLFFVADDQQAHAAVTGRLERYEDVVAQMRHLVEGRPQPRGTAQPLVAALSDLLGRTSARGQGTWEERFRGNLDRWLAGHLRENAYRRAGRVPSIEEYVTVRRDACTVFPTLDLVELCEQVEVPADVYRSGPYQTLISGTADIMCWINDIHSLERELAEGDPINLAIVLQQLRGMTAQEAVDHVAALVSVRVAEHLAAAAALPALMADMGVSRETQDKVMRCVRNQGSWAAAMTAWDRSGTIRHRDSMAAPGAAAYHTDLLTTD